MNEGKGKLRGWAWEARRKTFNKKKNGGGNVFYRFFYIVWLNDHIFIISVAYLKNYIWMSVFTVLRLRLK